jgi:hypothetical protein
MKKNKFLKSRGGILGWATLAFVIPFVLTGCAKDETLDEYHDQQVQQDLTRLNTFAGDYVGTLTNTGTGQTIGTFEVDLTTQLTATLNEESTQNTDFAGLAGTVIASSSTLPQGSTAISQASCPSSNDSNTCPFSGQLNVTLPNGVAATLALSGTISGNTFTGQLTSTNAQVTNSSFNLTRNGSSVAAGTSSLSTGNSSTGTLIYMGSYQDTNIGSTFVQSDPDKNKGGKSPQGSVETLGVVMTLYDAANDPGQIFVEYVSSQTLVDVNLSINSPNGLNDSNLAFTQVVLNKSTGYFRAQAQVATNTTQATLTCNQGARFNPSATWHCLYQDSQNGAQQSFTATAQTQNSKN